MPGMPFVPSCEQLLLILHDSARTTPPPEPANLPGQAWVELCPLYLAYLYKFVSILFSVLFIHLLNVNCLKAGILSCSLHIPALVTLPLQYRFVE